MDAEGAHMSQEGLRGQALIKNVRRLQAAPDETHRMARNRPVAPGPWQLQPVEDRPLKARGDCNKPSPPGIHRTILAKADGRPACLSGTVAIGLGPWGQVPHDLRN